MLIQVAPLPYLYICSNVLYNRLRPCEESKETGKLDEYRLDEGILGYKGHGGLGEGQVDAAEDGEGFKVEAEEATWKRD